MTRLLLTLTTAVALTALASQALSEPKHATSETTDISASKTNDRVPTRPLVFARSLTL